MKPRDPCYCGAYDFPHRYQAVGKRGCYEYVSRDDYENDDRSPEPDDCDAFHAKTDGMGEAEYARYMGRGNEI